MTTALDKIRAADAAARARLIRGGAKLPNVLPGVVHELCDDFEFAPAAAAELAKRAREDDELFREIMNGQLEAQCLKIMQEAMRNYTGEPDRSEDAVRRGPTPKPTLSAPVVQKWAQEVQAGLTETFRLPRADGSPGIRLCDATREQLGEAADTFHRQSHVSSINARWMMLIAQGLQPGERVKDRITDDRAKELRIEAMKDATLK